MVCVGSRMESRLDGEGKDAKKDLNRKEGRGRGHNEVSHVVVVGAE